MWAYVIWTLAFGAAISAATAVLLNLWTRRVLRERAEAQLLVEQMDAERRRHVDAERRAIEVLAASERRHRALAEAGAIGVWLADAGGRLLRLDGNWERLTGQAARLAIGHEQGWTDMIHPDERATAAEAWARAVATGTVYEAEYRLRDAASGDWRWCRARAVPIRAEPDAVAPSAEPGAGLLRADAGAGLTEGPILEWVGVVEDTDARRRAEAQQMILAREVNHRAKNALAVVQAVVRLSGGRDAAASGISERIAALARAHDLLAQAEWRGATLRDVAEREMAPFLGRAGTPRIGFAGEPVMLAAGVVQPLAMLLHELGTNAAKHGALAAGGRVELAWALRGEDLEIDWIERGGPPPADPPARTGFGSRLIEMTVRQLGGTVARSWPGSGLACRISLPAERVVVGGAVAPTVPRLAEPIGGKPAA